MKKSIQLLSILLVTLTSLSAAALPFPVKGLAGWKLTWLDPEGDLALKFGGPQAALATAAQLPAGAGPRGTAFIYSQALPHTLLGANPETWRKALLAHFSHYQVSALRDRVLERHGHRMYFADLEVAYSANIKHRSTVLMTVVGGEVKLLVYEATSVTYQSNAAEVKALFNSIELW